MVAGRVVVSSNCTDSPSPSIFNSSFVLSPSSTTSTSSSALSHFAGGMQRGKTRTVAFVSNFASPLSCADKSFFFLVASLSSHLISQSHRSPIGTSPYESPSEPEEQLPEKVVRSMSWNLRIRYATIKAPMIQEHTTTIKGHVKHSHYSFFLFQTTHGV